MNQHWHCYGVQFQGEEMEKVLAFHTVAERKEWVEEEMLDLTTSRTLIGGVELSKSMGRQALRSLRWERHPHRR